MSHRGPSRVNDAKFPLAKHFHPRIHVEFEIVSRWIPFPKKRGDSQQTAPPKQQSARYRLSEQMAWLNFQCREWTCCAGGLKGEDSHAKVILLHRRNLRKINGD
jgi:hypothetical protein